MTRESRRSRDVSEWNTSEWVEWWNNLTPANRLRVWYYVTLDYPEYENYKTKSSVWFYHALSAMCPAISPLLTVPMSKENSKRILAHMVLAGFNVDGIVNP